MLRRRRPQLQQLTSDWNKHHWQRCDQYCSPDLRTQLAPLNLLLPRHHQQKGDFVVGIHCHWRMEVLFAAEVLQLQRLTWMC